MSNSEQDSQDLVDGTVLKDQVSACDDIIQAIIDNQQRKTDSASDKKPYVVVFDIYQRVRKHSVQAFEDRFLTSALYDALKILLRKIGEECGYEQRMHFTNRYGEDRVADNIENGVYWFKLYTGVILRRQPEITYEWAVPHFKEHRDLVVSHPTEVEPLRDVPDPTLVSSVVPLWYVLEDVLRLWREVLDIPTERRDHREQVLEGEETPADSSEAYQYGFVRGFNERSGKPDAGYITGYQNGEEGKGSRFKVGETDFFPSKGDVIRFQSEQQQDEDGNEYSTLSVTNTVTRLG